MKLRGASVAISIVSLSLFGCTRVDTPLPGGIAGAMDAGDIDGDGLADLAVSYFRNINSENLAVLLSNGDGTFEHLAVGPSESAAPAQDVALGDFDGDGALDLAAAFVFPNDTGETHVYLGDGTGGFARTAILEGPEFPQFLEADDLNGDGVDDLAVVGEIEGDPDFEGGLNVFVSEEDGTFVEPRDPGAADELFAAPPTSIATGHLGVSGSANNVFVTVDCCVLFYSTSLFDGFPSIRPRERQIDEDARLRGIEIGEFNGDDSPDAVVVDERGWLYTVHGAFENLLHDERTRRRVPGAPRAVATGTFGADSIPDAVIVDPDRDVAEAFGGLRLPWPTVSFLDDQHRFGAGIAQPVGPDPLEVEAADFNGDGRLDVATLNEGDVSVTVIIDSR